MNFNLMKAMKKFQRGLYTTMLCSLQRDPWAALLESLL